MYLYTHSKKNKNYKKEQKIVSTYSNLRLEALIKIKVCVVLQTNPFSVKERDDDLS